MKYYKIKCFCKDENNNNVICNEFLTYQSKESYDLLIMVLSKTYIYHHVFSSKKKSKVIFK